MPPERERPLYYQGIALFNGLDYFEAHEIWEEIWRLTGGLKHSFYQGLIQCAVALEHYCRSNPRGVRGLYQSYQNKFTHLPPVFMGLEIAPFLASMHSTLRPVLEAHPLPARGEIHFDPTHAPKIVLLHDPFDPDAL